MKKIQDKPDFKHTRNGANAKVTKAPFLVTTRQCGTAAVDVDGMLKGHARNIQLASVVNSIARATQRPVIWVDEFQAVATDDPQQHPHPLISFEGLTPEEIVEAIQAINVKGAGGPVDRSLSMQLLVGMFMDDIARDTLIETMGEKRLVALLSEYMIETVGEKRFTTLLSEFMGY